MKITNFYNYGKMIEITGNQTVNLHLDRGEVKIARQDEESHEKEEDTDDAGPEEEEEGASDPDAEVDALLAHFTDEEVKGSGIRMQPRVVLALMQAMRMRCTQKIGWVSFYSVLLNRGWMEANTSAYCRMVQSLFFVQLDSHNLNKHLSLHGTDYKKWTDADKRIKAHKDLAAEFDTRLTEYFIRKRSTIMEGIG